MINPKDCNLEFPICHSEDMLNYLIMECQIFRYFPISVTRKISGGRKNWCDLERPFLSSGNQISIATKPLPGILKFGKAGFGNCHNSLESALIFCEEPLEMMKKHPVERAGLEPARSLRPEGF